MQKFFIDRDRISDATAVIRGQDAKHLCKVLRLAPGQSVDLTDGRGCDYTGKITAISPGRVDLDLSPPSPSRTESPLPLTVCSGMLKHQKMDEVIKGLTQLGVTRWIPFFCQRAIPRPDARQVAKRMDRWQTIARESVKQCRRSRLVAISDPLPLDRVLDLAENCHHRIAFWENAEKPLSELAAQGKAQPTILLIGPEGGFSEQEIGLARSKGFEAYSLGPRILRAETAALAAAALVQHLMGDI